MKYLTVLKELTFTELLSIALVVIAPLAIVYGIVS